jgi:hypothetical protein
VEFASPSRVRVVRVVRVVGDGGGVSVVIVVIVAPATIGGRTAARESNRALRVSKLLRTEL